jgi:hypothetical protein
MTITLVSMGNPMETIIKVQKKVVTLVMDLERENPSVVPKMISTVEISNANIATRRILAIPLSIHI